MPIPTNVDALLNAANDMQTTLWNEEDSDMESIIDEEPPELVPPDPKAQQAWIL